MDYNRFEQDIMNLITIELLQSIGVSTPDARHYFIKYLEKVRRVFIVDCKEGSLIVTVKCSSLQTLDELWEDYCSGHLNEMAQKFLVTDEILKAFGLIEVKLSTVIDDDDYRDCRDYISALSLPGDYTCIL